MYMYVFRYRSNRATQRGVELSTPPGTNPNAQAVFEARIRMVSSRHKCEWCLEARMRMVSHVLVPSILTFRYHKLEFSCIEFMRQVERDNLWQFECLCMSFFDKAF